MTEMPIPAPAGGRFVGISVMPEWVQQNGDRVLQDLVDRAGATAIVTTPCVLEPSDAPGSSREPPVAGATLDRPLWGRTELNVLASPSIAHDAALFEGQRYRPPPPTELTRRAGGVVGDFVRRAKAAGLEVHLRVQAAAPPGYRAQFGDVDPDDRPLLPDGTALPDRLDRNGSLASPHIRAYLSSLIVDLCRHYPEIDGFHIDWPEYPPYTLHAVFFDFSDHAANAAARLRLDFKRMRVDVARLMSHVCGGLSDAEIEAIARSGLADTPLGALARAPGVADWIRLKETLVAEILGICRDAARSADGRPRAITPMAFPPPLSRISGMNYALAARHSGVLALKLIPSHWPMILRSFGDALRTANPRLDERTLVAALLALADIQEPRGAVELGAYRHPARGEMFDPGVGPQVRKIAEAQRLAGDVPVVPLLHSLGPADDFRARLATCYAAAGNRIWVNRYGFLSDAKLDAIGEVTR